MKKRSFSRTFGTFSSAEEAADVLRAFQKEIRAKCGQADGPAPAAAVRTLVEAQRAQLLDRSPRLKARTIETYKRENREAVKFFGRKVVLQSVDPETQTEIEVEHRDCPLSDLTRARIEEWIRFRLDTCEPGTVNRDLGRLRGVMRWAEREGWLTGGNPINQVRQLQELEGVIRYLEDDEEERLKQHCQPWLWRMVEFSFWTGLRRGEQLGLQWTQIKDGLIEVRAKDTKTSRSRWIPITETVAAILEEQRKATNAHAVWVFPNHSGKNRWNPYNLYKAWHKARTAALLPDYRWHDNRHTFCSRLVQEGVKLEKVQVLAGHRDFKTTLRYAHLAPKHLRGAVDALEARKRRQLLLLAGLQPRPPQEQPAGATQREEMASILAREPK